jgi:creatinine amidohydrolase/Fe(II)-dependent formamide hydrolase-like protein
VGNPAAATPEKGARYYAAMTEKIGTFLAELAATDRDALYK